MKTIDRSLQNTGRRRILQAGAHLAAACSALPSALLAQPARNSGRPLVVGQIVDMSASQLDVSKDFLIGSRAAWQDINARGGLRGRPVQHLSVETDGSTASLRAALVQLRDNPACVALSGTTGGAAASQLTQWLHSEGPALAHAAPWLPGVAEATDERTFAIFASRQTQIAYALKSLAGMGIRELGAVYASAQDEALYKDDVQRSASNLKLGLQSFRGAGDLRVLGQGLTSTTPAVLLFIGGTPELARFTQGMEKQARQRYVIALADVNLQTLAQLGAARQTSVIATQTVPMVTSSLAVVREYRQVLLRLYDEPPSPLSLAGFLAARYTFEVLSDVEAPLTRASALAGFQRRATIDLGGFQVSLQAGSASSHFVTQSMLTHDGRVIG